MFPLPWNFPFRKKDGTVVNVEDAMSGGGGGGSDLPDYDSSDAGKVLTVDDNGDLEWADSETELPEYSSSDEGKLLSVDSNGDLEWSDAPTELPEYSSSDEGKVLSVDSNGDLEWSNAETEIPEYDTSDAGKVLSVDDNGDLQWSDSVEDLSESVNDVEQLASSLSTEVADNWTKESYNLYKNTFYNPNHPDYDTHFSGLTFSPQQDKTIKVTGTTTEAFNKNYGGFYAKAGKTYRISNTESGISDNMEIELLGLAVSGGGFVTRFSSHNTEQVPNIYTCQADEYVYIYYKCPDASVEIDLTLYPMVVEVEVGAPMLGYKPFGYSNNDVSNQVDIINSKLPKYEVKKLDANATSIYFTVPNDGSYNVIDFYITDHSNYTALDTSVAGRATLTYEASNVDRYVTCVITKFELGG